MHTDRERMDRSVFRVPANDVASWKHEYRRCWVPEEYTTKITIGCTICDDYITPRVDAKQTGQTIPTASATMAMLWQTAYYAGRR